MLIGGDTEQPVEGEPNETHDTDALLFALYTLSLERVRPIFAREGDDEIRCNP